MLGETLNFECHKRSFECSADAAIKKLSVDEPTGLAMRGTQGVIYYLGEEETPLPIQADGACSNLTNCTIPTLLMVKRIPEPTLIVHEGQEVEIHV